MTDFSESAKNLSPGLYRHFKGGIYEVVGVGKLSEEEKVEMVIYKSQETGVIWLRPIEMFLEKIERENYNGPRFVKIN